MVTGDGETSGVPVVPGYSRTQLARRLRTLRVRAGLNTRELADRIGTSQSKISRTERAAFGASVELVRHWLDATGADQATRAEVLALATQSLVDVESYRSIFRGSIAAGQRIQRDRDSLSARIRHFQPLMIPGLLQTERYARAVLYTTGELADEADLEDAVAARIDRGRRIRSPGAPPYHVVLMEQAVHWAPVGLPPGEQEQTWRHLIRAGTVPTITIQLIPLGTPTPRAPLCGFLITEFPAELAEPALVEVELPPTHMTFSGEKDVEAFEQAWRDMLRVALTPTQTRAYLRKLLHDTNR